MSPEVTEGVVRVARPKPRSAPLCPAGHLSLKGENEKGDAPPNSDVTAEFEEEQA